LVISQKPKLIEMTSEYRILDDDGAEIGAIRVRESLRRGRPTPNTGSRRSPDLEAAMLSGRRSRPGGKIGACTT
jgi:hypothetical protein